MLKYINLTYKLIWFKYLNRQSVNISSGFSVLSIF